MKCRLCLKEKELCNSHIVPEFLFKALYAKEKHQFVQIEGAPKVRKWQKGFREKMLCRECEDRLNKWETYAAQVFFSGNKLSMEKMSDFIIIKNIDYTKFKLFQLSLIWRAGASNLHQFTNVSLGPHEEKLRSMLYEGNPGASYDYGCLIIFTPSYFDFTSKMMMLAKETRFDGHRCYMFVLAGLTWVFFISNHTGQLPYNEKLFLNYNGILPVLIENTASKEFFEKTFYGWKKSGNLSKAMAKT